MRLSLRSTSLFFIPCLLGLAAMPAWAADNLIAHGSFEDAVISGLGELDAPRAGEYNPL